MLTHFLFPLPFPSRLFLHLLFKNETAKLFVNDSDEAATLTELPTSVCWFPHPTDSSYRIYFIADMPHLIKKIRNATIPAKSVEGTESAAKKRKVQRSCKISGWEVNLGMAEAAYRGVGGCEGGELRWHYLTEAHFVLDAWSKMRFYLAAQVFSSTMILVIDEYCRAGGGKKEDYEGYVQLCRNVDALVDICNGTERNRSGEMRKGKRLIKSIAMDPASAEVVAELKRILLFFEKWRVSCGDRTDTEFITEESWEDLCTLICGNIDLVTFYGARFGADFVWNFRSGGSDVCEHHFSNTRAKVQGGNPSVRQCKSAAEASLNNRLISNVGGGVRGGNTEDPRKYKKKRKFN
jgi:hypothetical protein